MTEQTEALRLAEYMDAPLNNPADVADAAAAELRRLHAENETLRQQPAFDALVAISLLTHLGGEVADYGDVVEAVHRVHAVNQELLEALKLARPQLIGHAERTARAAIAKAEGQA